MFMSMSRVIMFSQLGLKNHLRIIFLCFTLDNIFLLLLSVRVCSPLHCKCVQSHKEKKKN